jgi:hypothetical protein
MKTVWQNNVYDVRECKVNPGSISEGDWVWLQGHDWLRVKVIQKDCPRIENLHSLFVMFTCEREDGSIVPVRGLCGEQSVLKRNKVKVVLRRD